MPAFAPIIQRSYNEFPKIATHIIESVGLKIDEFNALQSKLERNPFFRYQIRKEIDKSASSKP